MLGSQGTILLTGAEHREKVGLPEGRTQGRRTVGRVGTKPEDLPSLWKVSKDGRRLGGLRDDLECLGTTRNAWGQLRMLGGARYRLRRLGDSVVLGGNSGGLWMTR